MTRMLPGGLISDGGTHRLLRAVDDLAGTNLAAIDVVATLHGVSPGLLAVTAAEAEVKRLAKADPEAAQDWLAHLRDRLALDAALPRAAEIAPNLTRLALHEAAATLAVKQAPATPQETP